MRGLTLTRPWPFAILGLAPLAAKRVENRPVRYPAHLKGELICLHAGKTYDPEAADFILQTCGIEPPDDADCHQGIVGVCRVVGWMRKDTPNQLRGMLGPRVATGQDRWFFGPWGWILDDVQKLATPVPCRGMQGLWPVPPTIEEKVRAQLQGG